MFRSDDVYEQATRDASINNEYKIRDDRGIFLNNFFLFLLLLTILYFGIKYFSEPEVDSSTGLSPIAKTNVMGVMHTKKESMEQESTEEKKDTFLTVLDNMDVEPLVDKFSINTSYQSDLSKAMNTIIDASAHVPSSSYTKALSKEIGVPETEESLEKDDLLYQAELSKAMNSIIDFSLDGEEEEKYMRALAQEI